MTTESAKDPLIEAAIETVAEEALEGNEAVWPPEVVEEAKHLIRLGLRHHPEAHAWLRLMVEGPVVKESHKVDVRSFRADRSRRGGGDSGANGAARVDPVSSRRGGRR
jgi:hypothetical protein